MTAPRRRWRTFSLRALCIGTTLVAIVLGWTARRANQCHQIELIGQELAAAGGTLWYRALGSTPDEPDAATLFDDEPIGPAFLRCVLGEHFFCEPYAVTLGTKSDAQRGWNAARKLPGIQAIALCGDQFSEQQLADLGQFPQLTYLDLVINVEDAWLAHLRDCPRLQGLELYTDGVSDAGIEHLTCMTQLTRLNASNIPLTDVGLRAVATCTGLRSLEISNTQITDQGIRHLASLKQLETLDLRMDAIGDDCVETLCGLSQLEDLNISYTEITAEGLARLRRALPSAEIVSYNLEPASLGTGPHLSGGSVIIGFD